MIDYNIGDEVLCVDDLKSHWRVALDFQQWIAKGKKYIVRGFHDNGGIVVGVLLEGVNNKPIYIKLLDREQEPAFAPWRFVKARTLYQINEEKSEKLMTSPLTKEECYEKI